MAMPPDKTMADHGPPERAIPDAPETVSPPAGPAPPARPTYELAESPDPSNSPEPPAPAPVTTSTRDRAAEAPAPEADVSRSRAARRTSRLPKGPDRLIAWLAMLACLLVAAVPLSVGLWEMDTLPGLEADALARSSETWQQQVELPAAPGSMETWVPVSQAEPRLSEPPGGTWLHLLTFALFDSDPDSEALRNHARIASLMLALLTVMAVFWAAMSIGGLLPAILAGLATASLPVLLFYGRLAGDHLAPTALVTLAVAAAIWALRPLRPANHLARQALGWTLCGVLLGLATLTGGLPATAAALLPLVLILVLCPNRLNHVLGLVAAICLGTLITTPWALHVHGQDPDVWRTWIGQVVPPALDQQWPAMLQLAGRRLGLLLLIALPWTVWLIAGLMQPFSTSSAGARTRLFIGWVWFVSVLLLVLVVPGEGHVHELLLVLPPTALVVAQVIRQFRDLAAEGRGPRIWTWLCWPHAMALLVLSLVGPAALHFQPWLVDEQWLAQPVAAAMHPLYWGGVAAALLLLVGLSLRYVVRRYPGKATVCWAAWTVCAFSAAIYPIALGH